MPAQNNILWEIEPHTKAKHEILKAYLDAWLPIMSQYGFRKLLYIDAFSGPGKYLGGEDGSPIIALNAALNSTNPIKSQVHFIFIEKDRDRAAYLQSLLNTYQLPKNITFEVFSGELFSDVFPQIVTQYNQSLPPTFTFIDPFGWKDVPFKMISQILSYKSCEVLVNFMYEEINRFIFHPNQNKNFDDFFGTSKWREVVNYNNSNDRNRFFINLYENQLKNDAHVQYVRYFQMKNKSNRIDYYLFFGTNSIDGLKKMKKAMWKVDTSGDFAFSDATDPNQLTLFDNKPDFKFLRELILNRFTGKEVTIGEIEEFVLAETPFRETQYKRDVLRDLENEKILEIISSSPRRRKNTYGDENMKVYFKPSLLG